MNLDSIAARGALATTLAALLVMLVATPEPARAQRPAERLAGTVVLDGDPVAGVPVTLHRVTADSSGVLASTTSSDDGAFSFELPAADPGAFTVFFATADYRTVRYFGQPVHPGDDPDRYLVELRDTTTSPAALRISRRDLVLVPHADGGWEVNEVVRLRNTGPRTIVSASGMPTWQMHLPAGADEFEAGAGDLREDQVQRMGDRLLLLAPIQPGEREIFLRYRVPAAGRTEVPVGTVLDSINIFVQQPAPGITVAGVRPVDVIDVDGQRFVQMSAEGLAADSVLRMEWESGTAPINPVWAGVGASMVFLLIGAGAAVRNRTR